MISTRKTMVGIVAATTFAIAGTNVSAVFAQEVDPAEAVDPSVAGNVATTTTVVTTTTAPSAVGAGTTVTTAAAAPVAATAASTTAAVLGAEINADLPATGSNVDTPLKLAAALGAGGLGALLLARRRRPAPAA